MLNWGSVPTQASNIITNLKLKEKEFKNNVGELSLCTAFKFVLDRTTVCPGNRKKKKKIINKLICLHEKMRLTPFINYYNTLG